MDGLLVLLALIVLAIPVTIIALLIGQSRLRSRISDLEIKLDAVWSARTATPTPPIAPSHTAPHTGPDMVPLPSATPSATPSAAEGTRPDEVQVSTPVPGAWLVSGARRTPQGSEPEPPALDGPAPAAAQDGPIVLRRDRAAAFGAWMQRNWIYVISAVSLALAGVFLVQYSVQNGLLPPQARVVAAYLFGAALIAAGEWLRRRKGDGEASDTAYVPSVFAGAGIVTLFAATIAAEQLYQLIGPNMALALHVLTGALAVVLGWFYGPLLVAVGLTGAAAAPFLVASDAGPTPLLYFYYAVIAATGLAVDAVRRWAWVSVLALVLGFAGAAVMMAGGAGQGPWIGFLLAMPALAMMLPPLRLIPDHAGPATLQTLVTNGKSGWPNFPVRLVVGTVLTATVALVMLRDDTALIGLLVLAGLALLALALLIWAEKAEGLADLAVLPAVAVVLRLWYEAVQYWPLAADFQAQAIALRPPESAAPMTLTLVVALAAAISAAFAWRALRGGPLALVHGLGAVLTASVAVAVLEFVWQPALVLGPWGWALHPMVLAAAMVALAGRFAVADGPDHRRMAHATLSALSLIALSLFILTSATALTLALAALVIAAAWLDRRFTLREMGLFIQIAVAVIAYRLLVDPGIDWAMDAPLLPVLMAFTGVIGAAVAAYHLLRDKGRVMTSGVLESAAMALAAILANVLLTRWLVPRDSPGSALDLNYAATLNAMPWLVLALTQLYRAGLGPTLRRLRIGLACLAGLLAAGGLLWSALPLNPLFAAYEDGIGAKVIGPMVLDTLALSYAMPGLVLLAAAWRLRLSRPLTTALLALGSGLVVLYAGLEIRRFWQGDWLGRPGVSQYELYSYTIALMLIGAALLYQSIARRSVTLRRIAMTVIALTVAKVFLLDAAGLTGLTRVFSFLGLGLSLAGLAWVNRWADKLSAK